MIAWLLSELWPFIAAAVGGFALWRAGRSKGRSDAASKAAKDYRDTRKRIDHETRYAGTGTDDNIRERLRKRSEQ